MFKSPGQASFDKLLEKATSNLLLEPDWTSIMQICDLIRQKDCPAKYAVIAIKKKLYHSNPHVVLFDLMVLESVVKNCGSPVQEEIATKSFMEELRELIKTSQHENVRDKILELVQAWAHAFRKLPAFRAVQDVVNIMKAEGMKFPPMSEADAMFKADTAPEWADGGCCHRCRVEFGLMNRKHHCRACGQIFCAKCSSKTATLPNFGIEKEVRVCDSCFEKHGNRESGTVDDPAELLMRASAQPQSNSNKTPTPQAPKGKTDEELAEEEQLQLALAISQSEAEAKERDSRGSRGGMLGHSSASTEHDKATTNKAASSSSGKSGGFESEDPELARYLDRTYWEQRQKQEDKKEETGTKVKAATTSPAVKHPSGHGPSFVTMTFQPSAPVKENKDKGEQVEEIDNFGESLRGQIEMFVNRMKSNSSRGRLISYDSSVQSLFLNITALHSQLLNYIQEQDNWRSYYEGLQDKLSQVKDARDALDALRKEHHDHLKQLAEEAERQRQYQMAQKLQVMRQKKHEYLQYQRQLALQRVQEQERQMQMRIEQQRASSMVPAGYGSFGQPPQGYIQGQPGLPPDHQMQYMMQGGLPPSGQFMGPPSSVAPGGIPPMQNLGQYMSPDGGQINSPYLQHQHSQAGTFIPMQMHTQGTPPQVQIQQGPPQPQTIPGQPQMQHPPQPHTIPVQPQMQHPPQGHALQQGPPMQPQGQMQQGPQQQPQGQMQQGPTQQPHVQMQQGPIQQPQVQMQQGPIQQPQVQMQQGPPQQPQVQMQQVPPQLPQGQMQQGPAQPPQGQMQQGAPQPPQGQMQQGPAQPSQGQMQQGPPQLPSGQIQQGLSSQPLSQIQQGPPQQPESQIQQTPPQQPQIHQGQPQQNQPYFPTPEQSQPSGVLSPQQSQSQTQLNLPDVPNEPLPEIKPEPSTAELISFD